MKSERIINDVFWLKKTGEKNIQNAIFNDHVKAAFMDFIKEMPEGDWAVIGGIAVSTWAMPRETHDIDIIVVSNISKNLPSFKKNRPSAIEHKKTGVEVELLKASVINQKNDLIQKAINNAIIQDVEGKKVKIVSPKYLIALKLGRAIEESSKGYYDRGDILALLKIYGKQDLSDLDLPQKQIKLYSELLSK